MENDVKKDFDTAYHDALTFWSGYFDEAKKDAEFYLGNQWNATDAAYLKKQGREALVFRKLQRVMKLITGYQRKNRLSLIAGAVEGADEKTASQFSKLLLWSMQQGNIYNTLSDAFEFGALNTGLNNVELYLDYSEDPINGDIRLRRWPYNRLLLDPAFTERDLKDCGYILTRDYLTKEGVKQLLPASKRNIIDEMTPKGRDGKYTYYSPSVGINKNKFPYDQFFVKTSEKYKVLVDPQTQAMKEWTGSEERLRDYLEYLESVYGERPKITIIEGWKDTVKLNVLVNGEVIVEKDPNPTGLDEYNFVPIMGFWMPEYDEAKWKLQGITRCMRDPQTEINKRRSKMLDILDSQISSGWVARAGGVVNKDAMYQSGQGQVIWLNENTYKDLSVDQIVKQINPSPVPEGLFRSIDIFDKDILEIPGANSELMGMPENEDIQIAGILAKMRQGQGLTILQDLFDNYRLSKKLIGEKKIKIMQKNWNAWKVARIINEQPTQEFYNKNFGKYDAVPVEGALTDTQKQMNFNQLAALRMMGVEIPGTAIIEASSLVDKEKLIKAMQDQAKSQEQLQQLNNQLQQLNIALLQSKVVENRANAAEQVSQVQENRGNYMLDYIRAIKEMNNMDGKMDLDRVEKQMQILQLLNEIGQKDVLKNTPAAGNA